VVRIHHQPLTSGHSVTFYFRSQHGCASLRFCKRPAAIPQRDTQTKKFQAMVRLAFRIPRSDPIKLARGRSKDPSALPVPGEEYEWFNL
jgi:hypothetical protein